MRYLWLLMAPLMLAQSGCDTTYPNEEMDIAGSDRTRPFAIVCEPAEAVPGEMVGVWLFYYEPDTDLRDVSWQVALDYDMGLYEADEIERDIRPIHVPHLPSPDPQGFFQHYGSYQVPDDALLRATSLPEVITDELVLSLARPLLDKESQTPVTKREIDVFLADVAGTEDWDLAVDPDTAAAIRLLSDLFASRIRFRATINGTVHVDVTKTLTIRYSREIGTINVNENTTGASPRIVAVPHPDVAFEDYSQYADEIMIFELTRLYPLLPYEDPTPVPLHTDWTYYLTTALSLQHYVSPHEQQVQQEDYILRWYHYGLTSGAAAHPLFAQDDGGEAEMGDLDSDVRLIAPATGTGYEYRIITCAYDYRVEWRSYAATPGTDFMMSSFVFEAP